MVMEMVSPLSPNDVEIAPGVTLPAAALRWSFARSGGPGGQNVNKVATKAVLRVALDDLRLVLPDWAVGRLVTLAGSLATEAELILSADNSRSQLSNRKACLGKLRALVVEALNRPRKRKATRPSQASIRRRLEAKKQRGRLKQTRQRPRDDA